MSLIQISLRSGGPIYQQLKEEVIRLAGDADVLLNQYAPMNARVIAQLKNCKAIIRYGIGVDTVDIDAATARGIYVCNVPDYGVDETSNQTIAMILAMARKLPIIHADVRRGGWGLSSGKTMYRFAGSTLGFVGLGRIASAVVEKLRPFSLNMIAYDPYIDPARAEEMGVKLVDFDTLLRTSDYVTIHCPATAENRHMFDAEAFGKMKKTAYLINCARGAIVDTKALIDALEQEKIAGEFTAERRSQVGTGMRNERIRTYNFPQGRVTDHRIGLTLYKIESIMDGDLDEIMDALAAADQAERLKEQG